MDNCFVIPEHKYKEYFVKIEPKKLIAPFGFVWKNYLLPEELKVITIKDFVNNFFDVWKVEIRTRESIHAKLVLGEKGALFGSWNWSLEHDKKPRNREIVIFVSKDNMLYHDLNKAFDLLWETSHKFEGSDV